MNNVATPLEEGKNVQGLSEGERRYNMGQAIASARIEGFEPTAEFLADCEAIVQGKMTREQVRARSLHRAMAQTEPHSSEAE